MTATPPQLEVHPEPSGLIRGLGLWSATAIVIGDTIGTRIDAESLFIGCRCPPVSEIEGRILSHS